MKAPSRSFAYHGGNSQGEGDQEVTDNRQVLFSLLSSYTHVPHFIAFQFITHHRYSVFFTNLRFVVILLSESISAIFPIGSDDGWHFFLSNKLFFKLRYPQFSFSFLFIFFTHNTIAYIIKYK